MKPVLGTPERYRLYGDFITDKARVGGYTISNHKRRLPRGKPVTERRTPFFVAVFVRIADPAGASEKYAAFTAHRQFAGLINGDFLLNHKKAGAKHEEKGCHHRWCGRRRKLCGKAQKAG
ncbi:MAG: hypothetical protein AB7C89_08170, partial [Intestinibacillus sp.]